jgi:hypothetical protein
MCFFLFLDGTYGSSGVLWLIAARSASRTSVAVVKPTRATRWPGEPDKTHLHKWCGRQTELCNRHSNKAFKKTFQTFFTHILWLFYRLFVWALFGVCVALSFLDQLVNSERCCSGSGHPPFTMSNRSRKKGTAVPPMGSSGAAATPARNSAVDDLSLTPVMRIASGLGRANGEPAAASLQDEVRQHKW